MKDYVFENQEMETKIILNISIITMAIQEHISIVKNDELDYKTRDLRGGEIRI